MKLTISDGIRQAKMFVDANEFSGVKKIAAKVLKDIYLVTNKSCEMIEGRPQENEVCDCIIVGTVANSMMLGLFEKEGRLDLSKVRGKREVYSFSIIKKKEKEAHSTLVIAGSDKRGAIYGLFHLSELLGVSPWVYFADVFPPKHEKVILTDEINMVSKPPSVKYRGFFINDEWPSFGNWTYGHFGGFTAEMYEKVFELLLRLKGNYLWPAMWTSSFSLDGPEMASALLADEYGIVMSNSHHEPCLRHSEEWDMVKGEASIYGADWNFDKNRNGLINYWRDGLKRNGKLENIITLGMRGERDSEILEHEASLKDNIDYLKEVINVQNDLIRENVNDDLAEVPRILVLYKEVEAYFYGDSDTAGLKDWEGLDGVTLMLCEDNFGNMRTLPNEKNRNRKGGWGMYYHFDYHGDPVSYEWVNSTHLSKVWEQMTQAYDFGVRDIWIVNVGDLKPQELPISYFLDLAYDFDSWGTYAPNKTGEYTKKWLAAQFGQYLSENPAGKECLNKWIDKAYFIVDGYTRLNSIRRPEALSPYTYHAVNYGESDRMLCRAEEIIGVCEELKSAIFNKMTYASFFELIYYPAAASMNQLKLMLYAGKNELYASQGRLMANIYADKMRECIKRDRELREEYHSIEDGKWNGMMLSEHIGFVHWNAEECRYPIYHYIEPAQSPRMVVSLKDNEQYSMGGDWTRKTLEAREPLDMGTDCVVIEIANGSIEPFQYHVESDAQWISLSENKGIVELQNELTIRIDRKKIPAEHNDTAIANVSICTSFAHVDVKVYASHKKRIPRMLVIEACDYKTKSDAYQILEPYGKYKAGAKAYPQNISFNPDKDAPSIAYSFVADKKDIYEFDILTAPSNPSDINGKLRIGFQLNDEPVKIINTVSETYRGGDRFCEEWAKGVLDNIHTTTLQAEVKAGENHITIYAYDAQVVLERIEVRQKSFEKKYGYMGLFP